MRWPSVTAAADARSGKLAAAQRRSRGWLGLGLLVWGCAGDPEPTPGVTTAADTAMGPVTADTQSPPSTGGTDGDTASPTQGDPDDGSDAATSPTLPEFPCERREECVLHSDCCTCEALHREQPAPSCADESCTRGLCDVWGVQTLLCSHSCHIRLLECDPAMVTCDEAPPVCDEGFSPWVDERCWSGRCIPDDLCVPY